MKELYFFDETFYWGRSGRRATVAEAECELTQSVRPDELRKAVVSALRVHRNFRARPVIVGRRFFVEDSEAEQVMVVSEADGLPRNVGTKETGGLMLYVSYGERRFTLHVFHGLGDMRSMSAFLHTVLRFYCHVDDDSLPAADSMDTFPCHEHILGGGAPGASEGKFVPQEHDIFHLPERLFSTRTTRQHIIDIDVPLAPLLVFARESGSSVVPALNAVIGRAIRQRYDVGQKEIVCYTPKDLRPVFHFETGGNGAIPFSLPYTRPENLYTTVAQLRADFDQIFAAPLPVTKVSPMVVKSGRLKDSAFCTYGISYAGHLDFSEHQGGDAIASQVQAVGFSAGSYSYPLWIAACEYKGILRMRLVQSFESDRLATVVHQELAALFPGTTYTDRGHHDFDSFPLGSVPRRPEAGLAPPSRDELRRAGAGRADHRRTGRQGESGA